jgi:hypothetical protein
MRHDRLLSKVPREALRFGVFRLVFLLIRGISAIRGQAVFDSFGLIEPQALPDRGPAVRNRPAQSSRPVQSSSIT